MKNKHFEDLWNECETFHGKKSHDNSNTILEELILKINLYRSFCDLNIPDDEKQKLKSRTFGEILFTLSSLSNVENINVYKSLYMALMDHAIENA